MRTFLLPVLSLVVLGGCGTYLPWRTVPDAGPGRVPLSVPEEFDEGGAEGPLADRWWTGLGDPHLSRLVERALSGNLTLRQAWARLGQANAVVAGTAAARFPEMTGEGQATRQRSVFFAGEELGGERAFVSAQLLGVFAASWELDLWRRVGSLADAAENDREAARDDLEAAAITLVGEIAETWVSLAERKARLALLREQEKVSDQLEELVDLRFGQGLSTAPDVLQQRQQAASVRTLVPPVEAEIAVLDHRLDVLTGSPPDGTAFPAPAALPEPPPVSAPGLPAGLLRRRPDVRAAERRLAAADHRVAVAVAERFPAIRLSGRTGWQGFEANELPANWIWTITSNVVTPLFDAGRRRAEVDRSRAALDERLAAYGEAVLRAFEEVENALVQERHQQEQIDELRRQLDLARRAYGEIRGRYAQGLGDYVQVLTALQSLQEVERRELEARKQLLSFRIRLHRALGGSWTADLEPPPAVHVEPESPLLRWVTFDGS